MEQQSAGQAAQSATSQIGSPPARRQGRAWVWILIAALSVFVAPAVGCGAFGLALVLGSRPPTSAGLGPAVGIVRVEGVIFSGRSGSSLNSAGAGSETVIDLLEQANSDDSIKAIVLRIDSPGGGVAASDEIHHAILQVDKPVVVSMGSLAASGGYYIAAPADYIFATPHTLTGSIGVISQFITGEELLDEVGIEVIVVTAGEVKDFGGFHRDVTEEEIAYWQEVINEAYEGFLQVVADGRDMDIETVRELATGQVYTGHQALELGLIDEVGYFDDAVAKAAEIGGISGEPRVVELQPEPGLFDLLYGIQTTRQDQASLTTALEVLRLIAAPTLEFRYIGPNSER